MLWNIKTAKFLTVLGKKKKKLKLLIEANVMIKKNEYDANHELHFFIIIS